MRRTPLGSQFPRYDFRLWSEGAGFRVGVQVTSWLAGGLIMLWPVVSMGWRRDLPDDARRLHEVLTGSDAEADVGFEPGSVVAAVRPRPRRRQVRGPRLPAAHG